MVSTLSFARHARLLADVDLFAGLDRLALAKLAGYVEVVKCAPGVAVFQQGDPSDCLYVVARHL